jgi:hypothetical protein
MVDRRSGKLLIKNRPWTTAAQAWQVTLEFRYVIAGQMPGKRYLATGGW